MSTNYKHLSGMTQHLRCSSVYLPGFIRNSGFITNVRRSAHLVHLVDAEVVVLLGEELEQHLDPVILAWQPDINALGESPENRIVKILKTKICDENK